MEVFRRASARLSIERTYSLTQSCSPRQFLAAQAAGVTFGVRASLRLRLQHVHLRCASTRAHHDAFRLFTIACHSQSSGCTAGPPTQVSCASSTGGLPKVSSWRYPSALNLIISAATSADDVLSIQMRCTNDSPFRNIAQVSNQQEGHMS